jgi:8-oxo-dGTP diphosphatase
MTFKDNGRCPACGRYANRGITIDALVKRGSEILLIKRGREPFKDFWALPGGYVDWDETVEDAVRREVKEEIGVTVTSLELIGVYSRPDRHPEQAVAVAYRVEIEGEVQAGDDAVEFRWFPLDALPELAFDHAEIIGDAEKVRRGV